MRKWVSLFIIIWYLLCSILITGAVTNLDGVDSTKTAASSDKPRWIILEPNISPGITENIVYKSGDSLAFNFAAGLGDEQGEGSYGFQPNSSYMFEKLFSVTNNKNGDLDLWISVHGAMKEFDWINIYSDNGWDKNKDPNEKAMTLSENEIFYISVDFINIPSNAVIDEYMGEINFHTRNLDENVEDTPTETSEEGPSGTTSNLPDKATPGKDNNTSETEANKTPEDTVEHTAPQTSNVGLIRYIIFAIAAGAFIFINKKYLLYKSTTL